MFIDPNFPSGRNFVYKNTHHCKTISQKQKQNKSIKILCHYSWGTKKNNLLAIYKSLILFIIDYDPIIYFSVKPNIINIIDPIYNEGIRLVVGESLTYKKTYVSKSFY